MFLSSKQRQLSPHSFYDKACVVMKIFKVDRALGQYLLFHLAFLMQVFSFSEIMLRLSSWSLFY